MKLYNTLTRNIEEVQPMKGKKLGLYACGLTVYDFTHLGHLRKYTMDDILIRTLRHAGFEVMFVQNVTDVGHLTSDGDTGMDKLEKGAQKYGKSAWDIAREFEDYFWKSMDLMGNVRPDVSCRATEHIKHQLQLVQKLKKRGFTYVIEGDGVYFDTSKLDDYGKLALIDIDQLREGARVERVPGKKNPIDFALWKFERAGENRAMAWPSPWHPRSFPGWHIECSAMSMEYLGDQFEIHTGGIDHINVHHTNEIAQTEAATGQKPFVKYWVHHNHLFVDGIKMSKSLGNFFTIDDVLKRSLNPRALRLLFLTTHYRSEMNFTWQNLEGMQKTYDRLVQQLVSLKVESGRTVLSPEKLAKVDEYRLRFFGALENDLKTSEAVVIMWEVLKSNIPGGDKYDLINEFDEVLGLGLSQVVSQVSELGESLNKMTIPMADLPAGVNHLLEKRQLARDKKNWPAADELRQVLQKMGYLVTDKPGVGQVVSKT